MSKVFISSPFFSKAQINKVKQVEQALRDNPTVDSYYSPRLHQAGDGYPQWSTKWCQATFHHDLQGVKNADVSLEILDFDNSDADSGTSFEMGYAYAIGRFRATISFDKYPVNLMLGVGSDHYFDNLAKLRRYDFNKREKNVFTGKMH